MTVGGLSLSPDDPLLSEVTAKKETTGTKFVTTTQAAEALKSDFVDRPPYTLDQANFEKPHTHYTRPGNIFQILRFGLQSDNFKNRLAPLRAPDSDVDRYARQMCGFRVKPGGSYQGRDSISLSLYDRNPNQGSDFYLLINPRVQVWGAGDRDSSTGYGHGIPVRNVNGDYEIGNPTAYKTEVVAGNVVLPEDIRAVVAGPQTNILRDMAQLTQDQALLYSQQKHTNPGLAAENMLANARLLADLSGDAGLAQEADQLSGQLSGLSHREVTLGVIALQKKGLQSLVGDQELTEPNLRSAISRRMNITFIVK